MQYQVQFDHSIQRHGDFSYISQSQNQGSIVVQAQSQSQAENLVQAMMGGHENCQIKYVQGL
jgi:hypothetical protein